MLKFAYIIYIERENGGKFIKNIKDKIIQYEKVKF